MTTAQPSGGHGTGRVDERVTAPLIGRDAVPPLRDRDGTGRGDVIGRPAGPPLSAVESVRAERIHRAVFGHAKNVHVLEGAAHIETATGIHELTPGYAMALGAGMWCSVRPDPTVRLWTLYFDESFLRSHMRWVLADTTRVRPGVHEPRLALRRARVPARVDELLRPISRGRHDAAPLLRRGQAPAPRRCAPPWGRGDARTCASWAAQAQSTPPAAISRSTRSRPTSMWWPGRERHARRQGCRSPSKTRWRWAGFARSWSIRPDPASSRYALKVSCTRSGRKREPPFA